MTTAAVDRVILICVSTFKRLERLWLPLGRGMLAKQQKNTVF